MRTRVGDDWVATITLCGPPNNFLSVPLVEAIGDAVCALEQESRCRAIVLEADGKHFCAGADHNDRDSALSPERLARAVRSVVIGSKPIIAAVQGAAVGAGLGLACLADFRICAPEARFSANFARLGLHHGFGLTLTLPRIIGPQQALDLLYTGRRLSGDEATRIGLADWVVNLDELQSAAQDRARDIAQSAPLAVRAIRDTMRADLIASLKAVVLAEAKEQDRLRLTNDFAEGVSAVAERRAGNFTGT